MKIEVQNLDTVIKELKAYRDNFDNRFKKYLEALGELGYETAGAKLQSAIYDGDLSVAKVETPAWLDDKTLVIEATGYTVWFIEFGTGITYPDDHPKANEMGAIRGSYGKGYGNRPTWGYYGEPGTNGAVIDDSRSLVLTHGNPANRFMYEGSKAIQEQYVELARRYFKE